MKNRTIITFGKPGEPGTILYSTQGKSVVIEELDPSSSQNIVGGQYVPSSQKVETTGREFELEFQSPELLARFIHSLIAIHGNLTHQNLVKKYHKIQQS